MDCEIIRLKLVRISVYAEIAAKRLANGDSAGVENALTDIEANIAKIRAEQSGPFDAASHIGADGLAFCPKHTPVLTEAKGDEFIPTTVTLTKSATGIIESYKPSKKNVPQTAEFQAKFNTFMIACQAMLNKHMTDHHPTLPLELLCPDEGNRYIRIWQRAPNEGPGHGSAWAFVDKTNGDILKPATWRAPAKHARGNIFHENPLKQVGPYGPNYLK